jgi:hypothetical protein
MEWIGRAQQDSSRKQWQLKLRTAARARRREVFLHHIRIESAFLERASKQSLRFTNARHAPIPKSFKTLGLAHHKAAIFSRIRELREKL